MNEDPRNLAAAQEQVENCIAYYEVQANPQSDDPSMWLGLFMAKQLNELLNEPKPDVEEVRLLFKALNKNGDIHGSQWHWMSSVAKWWLEELEAQNEKS